MSTYGTDAKVGLLNAAGEAPRLSPAASADDCGALAPIALDPLRFAALAQFVIVSSMAAMQWITYAAIVNEVKEFFGMDSFQVDLLAISYEVIYVVAIVATLYSFQRFSLKTNVRFATHLNTAAAALKLLSVLAYPSFALLLAAQVMLSLATNVVLTAPPVLTAAWFGEHERTAATAVGALATNLGIAFGSLVPALIVTPAAHGTAQFAALFALQLAVSAVASVLDVFVVPAGPKSPPTATALAAAADGSGDAVPPVTLVAVFAATRQACRNRAFLLTWAALTLFLAGVWTIGGVLPQVFGPFGVSEKMCGWMAFTGIAVGTFAGFGVAMGLDRLRVYKWPIVAAAVVAAGCLAGATFAAMAGAGHAAIFALYAVFALMFCIVIPLTFEFAVELTFPVDPSVSAGLLMWGGNLSSCIMYFAMPTMLGNHPDRTQAATVLLVFAAVVLASGVCFALVPPNMKRKEFEAAARRGEGEVLDASMKTDV
jgi:MFS family permease